MKLKSIAVISLAMASRLGQAQETDSIKTIELNPVTISASRSERNTMSVGRSVSVISNEQIKSSGANSFSELLSQEEGIYVVGSGQNPGQLQNIFMRGANSNQTAFIIDGIRLTEASATDNAIDLSELTLSNIDRIEIIRGSQSTLYGSSAIGGVINVITKRKLSPGIHTDFELESGSFGPGTSSFREKAFLNYTFKNGFYIDGSALANNVKGLDATVDTVTNPKDYIHNHRDKDGFEQLDLSGKVGYKSKKADVYIGYKNLGQKADIDAGAFTDDPAYSVSFNRNLYTFNGRYKFSGKFEISYIGGITDTKRIALDDSSIINYSGVYNHNYFKGTYKGNTSTNEIQANFKSKGLNVVFGGGLFDEKMTIESYYYSSAYGTYIFQSSLDSLKINVKTINEFLHADIDGSIINDDFKSFSLALGIRNTKHDLFGNRITYEINPSFKVTQNSLIFASFTTGFNAPSLYQLFSPDKDPVSDITRGNRTLRPETSASFEFGFKQKVNDKLFWSLSYFKTVVENSIDYVYLWNKAKRIDSLGYSDYRGDTYVNIGKQTNQGVELVINSKITDKLTIAGNVSLISGKLDYNPSGLDTIHTKSNTIQLFSNGAFIDKKIQTVGLVRRPSTGNLNITYKVNNQLSLTANIKYVGTRTDIYYNSALGPLGALSNNGLSDYTLFDFVFRYCFTKNLTATLLTENIFNVKYSEIYGYTTRGRGFYLNLRYSL
jgi:vitamin B12 transporter